MKKYQTTVHFQNCKRFNLKMTIFTGIKWTFVIADIIYQQQFFIFPMLPSREKCTKTCHIFRYNIFYFCCMQITQMKHVTWAIEAEPRGSSSKFSKISPILRPNSFSSTSWTVSNGVAGALSHSVTNLLTHAAGAKSGFPRTWAIFNSSKNYKIFRHLTQENQWMKLPIKHH